MILPRILSGVVIAAVLIGIILGLPALWSAVAISVLLLAAGWEWSGFLGPVGPVQRLLFVVAGVAVSAALWRLSETPDGLRAALLAAAVFWTAALLWIALLPRSVSRPLVWLAGLAALPLAWMALARMRIDWHQGEYWVLYALCIVWFADTGAYFVGRRWGKRRLAPQVSPGKTWAGLGGGVLAAALLAMLATPWLSRSMPALVVLTVLVALYSVVGDLTESLFKRYAGLKDSGTIIPGHGGVLDRFDSLLAAAPLLMLGASFLGRLP